MALAAAKEPQREASLNHTPREPSQRSAPVRKHASGLGVFKWRKAGGNGAMYSLVVSYRVGVICRTCQRSIEVDDEYIQGIRATEMAAALYKSNGRTFPDLTNAAWQKTLTCENPDCRKTHEYRGGDLLLYDS
jgi:hypothetical protein